MLIDATHKIWIGGTAALAVGALALYAGLSRNTPGGLTGGSTTGLWYGLKSSSNYTTSLGVLWGLSSDVPINKRP